MMTFIMVWLAVGFLGALIARLTGEALELGLWVALTIMGFVGLLVSLEFPLRRLLRKKL